MSCSLYICLIWLLFFITDGVSFHFFMLTTFKLICPWSTITQRRFKFLSHIMVFFKFFYILIRTKKRLFCLAFRLHRWLLFVWFFFFSYVKPSVKNLFFKHKAFWCHFDSSLKFDKQINAVVKTRFFSVKIAIQLLQILCSLHWFPVCYRINLINFFFFF